MVEIDCYTAHYMYSSKLDIIIRKKRCYVIEGAPNVCVQK